MAFLSCCLDPEIFDGMLKKCADPHCCCGCCSALRPRYKRLVDSIFPINPQDGLVRNNMEKLTFYALSSPEKLDRIGEYLLYRVSRDISRHRNGYVTVAVEALDQLLVACHAQTLNLFVESFLKMVQKLLECPDPQLQLLATQSFVKFANIEEDTPSYHRRYDFFVSKFSSLCHSNSDDPNIRCRLRLAGLRGLQGVVRKTVSDDLQVNIWEKTHMDKIVPSLLFNMQDLSCGKIGTDVPDGGPVDEDMPCTMAESCLRELTGRLTFGNIKAVLQPVLKHIDNHELWVPNEFAVHTFKAIIFSIKPQYSYDVVQILLGHLEDHSKDSAKIREGMVDVLSKIISIAASESIGPSVVGTVNSLLTHLRSSVDCKSQDRKKLANEKRFQEAVIHTLGKFCCYQEVGQIKVMPFQDSESVFGIEKICHSSGDFRLLVEASEYEQSCEFVQSLPDYQKIEIMMFILGKVPLPEPNHPIHEVDVLVQNMLLKSLLKVGTKYTTVHLMTAFQQPFLEPLLRISLAPDPELRLLVQQILHTLIDRHNNLPKLQRFTLNIDNLELSVEKSSRQDVMFMKKSGQDLYLCIYNNLQFANNTNVNLEALFCTLALLSVEVTSDETIVDLVRLALTIQDMAISGGLAEQQKYMIHALVAWLLNLLSNLTAASAFGQYVDQVVKRRQELLPQLLPGANKLTGNTEFLPITGSILDEIIFDRNAIVEAFKSNDQDVSKLQLAFMPRQCSEAASVTRSISDLNSISVDVDSVASSPGITRKHPEEEITVESLKKMMAEPLDADRQAKEAKRKQITEEYRTTTFEELVAKSEAKTDQLQNKLNEIFGKITPPTAHEVHGNRPPGSPHPSVKLEEYNKVTNTLPIFEMQFPDLFVY